LRHINKVAWTKFLYGSNAGLLFSCHEFGCRKRNASGSNAPACPAVGEEQPLDAD
jgi:hypothetical protein